MEHKKCSICEKSTDEIKYGDIHLDGELVYYLLQDNKSNVCEDFALGLCDDTIKSKNYTKVRIFKKQRIEV